jgi:3-hydroxy-9,10-secoandrosta-1,3,5(10)-triene-9,17-dione monooxygenase
MSTHDELIDRCEKLVGALNDRAAEAEALRRLPDATIEDAGDADLFRMVVPPSLGGLGLGLDTLAQTTRILATGCPATAWTLSFLTMHSWLLGRMDPDAHDELFRDHGYALAPAPLNPSGTATPAEGGFRLTGRWDWATGIEHADWVLVHAIIDRPDELATAFLVVPRAEVAVEDVWFTSGMRATGSNAVVIDDVFVPTRRTMSSDVVMEQSQGGRHEGPADDPMAGYPVVAVLALVSAAPALGAAEAAVELFRARLGQRVLAYTLGDKQADQPAARVRLATAMAEVRSARAVWEQALAALTAAVEGGAPTVADRMDARLAAASTVRIARQAISTVCEGSGASIYAEGSPLQRLQRDVEVLKGHVIFDWDRCAELAGRIALGQDPSPLDMV